MIDIHSHILPGVDDGAITEADSIAMAKVAAASGITKVVASPHHMNGRYTNEKASIMRQVDILNELLRASNIELTVIPGQEVRIYGELLDDIEKGEILTVNQSRYLLLEFPFDSVPLYAEQLIYDLQMKDIIPIIVHPERNKELRKNHKKMYNLISKGALAQITAASLIGSFGKEAELFAHALIEHQLAHFIASDAHNIGIRSFELEKAYEMIKQRYGVETYYLFAENSHLVIDDMNVHKNEPFMIKKKKKGILRFFK